MDKFKRLYIEVNGVAIIDIENAYDIHVEQLTDWYEIEYKEYAGNVAISREVSIDLEKATSITIILK